MKEIPFAKNYKVTRCGQVIGARLGRPLKPTKIHNGYLRLGLKIDDGRYLSYLVHRLVAIVYIENPENKPEVNHKNGDKLDNRVENLEWVSRSENQKHAFATGLNSISGCRNPRNILTDSEVVEIYNSLLEGARSIDIAREKGVSKSAIDSIKYRKNWKYLLDDLPAIKVKKKNTLSEKKVRWVCERIQEGLTNKQILNMAKGISLDQIESIKYKKYFKNISCEYDW